MNNHITITFCGGAESVTGSNFLIEGEKIKILIDAGLFQGTDLLESRNRSVLPYNPKEIDFLIITHAHADHIGMIPRLIKEGFHGTIYSTPETRDLALPMLEDSLHILAENSKRKHLPLLYSEFDIAGSFQLWKGVAYHESVNLGEDISFVFCDTGHVLGSAMVQFSRAGKKLVFTGDLGNSPDPLLKDTEILSDADYLIMETVYGDRNHEPNEDRDARLRAALQETIKKGGTVIIPTFSLERTQVILYELNNMIEDGIVPKTPAFLDSPLAIKITSIYRHYSRDFNDAARARIAGGDDLFTFPMLKITERREQSEGIADVPAPKIIIAGSGMSVAGRVVSHLIRYLPDEKNSVLIVGYQSPGTLGRQLLDGNKELNIHGTRVPVRAKIWDIQGYSAHKDSDHLLQFVENTAKSLKQLFLVMGEPKSSLFFSQRLKNELDIDATIPTERQKAVLEF